MRSLSVVTRRVTNFFGEKRVEVAIRRNGLGGGDASIAWACARKISARNVRQMGRQ